MSDTRDDHDRQYRDSSKLAARARIHRHTIAPTPWFAWVAGHLPLAAGDRVLDIGCGPAWFWASVADRLPPGVELTLADRSPGMVAEAMERCAGLTLGALAGREADAAALPFPDDSFDAVVAMHMLYHLADPAAGIAEMARVLKPGGTLLVTTNGADNMRELYGLAAVLGGTPVEPVAALFGYETAERLLGRQFGNVVRSDYPARLRVTDADDVFAMLTSFPPGDGADAAGLEALRDAIDAAFASEGGALEVRRQTGLFLSHKAG
jgi:ubiquinone/menaquinone biosynthesis C-methylase UbiE